jgi:GNAT superfamily N-acetyltransferase
MNETKTTLTISRVTRANVDLAAAAWNAMADAGIAPFATTDAHTGLMSRLGDPARIVLYACDGSTPVGVSMFERMADKRVRLEAVAVRPEFRRRSIGAALLTQGLFAALPATAMFVVLPVDDRAAIAWARERSFTPRPRDETRDAPGMIEYELRLDAPAHGCGSAGGCSCGGDGCGAGTL